jgi:hypothetical protein
MQTPNTPEDLLFVYSEPQVTGEEFAVGLIPRESFAEVREDYLEPILATRFPLNYLHPDSVVHLLREGSLEQILRLRPRPAGQFLAILPRNLTSRRLTVETVLRQAGFQPESELLWTLRVCPTQSPSPNPGP